MLRTDNRWRGEVESFAGVTWNRQAADDDDDDDDIRHKYMRDRIKREEKEK